MVYSKLIRIKKKTDTGKWKPLAVSLLFICLLLPVFPFVAEAGSAEKSIYTTVWEDDYGDVVWGDPNVTTDKKPHIDLKACYVGNNNTTLFIRMDVYGSIKDNDNVIYICQFETYGDAAGVNYKNKRAVFSTSGGASHDIPAYYTGSSLFFEVPIGYFENAECIWNGSMLGVWPRADDHSYEWYTDSIEIHRYNLTNYREREGFPRAYIEYILPSPAIAGDTVYFSGYGITSENASIVEYEWIVNGELMSNQSSFAIENISTGAYIFFRVKDSNNNWSKQIVERLYVDSSELLDWPVVKILSLSSGEKVSGNVKIAYEAHSKGNRTLKRIELQIDAEDWITILDDLNVKNVSSHYYWDSTKVENGWYTIRVRAYDDTGNWSTDFHMVYVDNTIWGIPKKELTLIFSIVTIMGVIIALIAIKTKIKKRKNMIDEGMI
ncbi:MAG: hypothetical protein QMC80_00690 [Thermoplasmatales archaeon]|nr:hypothetical protein [Thermoplasmatales archaeon]